MKEFTSAKILKDLMMGGFPKAPRIPMPITDIRDVADAHVNALEKGVHGTRYLLNFQDDFPMIVDLGRILAEEFKGTKYKIPTEELGFYLFKLVSICDKRLSSFEPQWGMKFRLDREKSIKELGLVYIPLKQSLVEMAHNLIDLEYFEDRRLRE
jgi:nucleoside-diphosphate-sugar epimerase